MKLFRNNYFGKLKIILKLLRVEQWYKNGVVFIALLFSENLFKVDMLLVTGMAFFGLCFISSANYIINDIKDKEKDVLHPLKKFRAISAKLISEKEAKFWVFGLLIVGLGLAYSINSYFFVMAIFLFLLMQVYTYWAKYYLYLDVLMISAFFVIRAMMGALAINVWISPWLIICPFFLAVFLVASKRYADLAMYPKKTIIKTREVLGKYSLNSAKLLLNIGAVMLVLSFIIYSIQKNAFFLLSVPFAGLAILRYMQLVFLNPLVGLHSEKALKDWKLLGLAVLWVIIILLVLY